MATSSSTISAFSVNQAICPPPSVQYIPAPYQPLPVVPVSKEIKN